MDQEQAKIRVEELRNILRENSRRYYVDNAPTMSDFEYDHLMRELEDLEKEYPDLRERAFRAICGAGFQDWISYKE